MAPRWVFRCHRTLGEVIETERLIRAAALRPLPRAAAARLRQLAAARIAAGIGPDGVAIVPPLRNVHR